MRLLEQCDDDIRSSETIVQALKDKLEVRVLGGAIAPPPPTSLIYMEWEATLKAELDR